ncbi:BatD family protein [Motilimonas pumila]|uniref:Protein BatD n=1 Tax=Motilimonas pumila TaxID=2303987 RepID=A0A418YHW0_9GAMM|nr:BatD family protein [Motilimonas pumila]RJG49916.1 hypothetical protein D1Z90_04540 [Motilimonas pumila]
MSKVSLYWWLMILACGLLMPLADAEGNESATSTASQNARLTQEAAPVQAWVDVELKQRHPVVGQSLTLVYDVYVPGYFNGATEFSLASLSHARLQQRSQFAINGAKTMHGVQYASQRWEITVIPEQAGLITIPTQSFKVKFINAAGQAQQVNVQAQAMDIFAYVPSELAQQKNYFVASDVSLKQSWSAPKADYQVGDIIRREVTVKASDISSIQLPHFQPLVPRGIRVTQLEPSLKDSNNRGQQSATMTLVLQYHIAQAGRYQLGGETITWWQLDQGLQQKSFKTQQFEVPGFTLQWIWSILAIVIFLLCLSACYWLYLKYKRSLTGRIKHAYHQQQWSRLIALLYQRADRRGVLAQLKRLPGGQWLVPLFSQEYGAAQYQLSETEKKQLKKIC